MDFLKLCFYFFAYAFLGWCVEVIFAALKTGRFVNRGFLAGPVCPVYGFGMVVVILLLSGLSDTLFTLFAGSFLLTSFIEFLTGFLLERVFNDKWWDYSDEHFNIRGYVCLKFSILWGLACTFIMKIVHPMLRDLAMRIPEKLLAAMVALFTAIILADLAFTLSVILKIKRRIRLVDQLSSELKKLSDKIGTGLYDGVMLGEKGAEKMKTLGTEQAQKIKNYAEDQQQKIESIKDKLSELKELRSSGYNRLKKAFPRLKLNFKEFNGKKK